MKLIAKAKPVKIRIKSGNEEHSSLESLRKNFVWEDVRQLFDGGLDRWLRRIDETEIADRIKELDEPENDILAIYNILFRAESPLSSEKDVFEELSKDRHLLPIAKEIISNLSVENALKYVYTYDLDQELLSIMKEHIIEFTKSFDNDFEDDNILYEVGKFLNNQSTNVEIKDLANRCIELASKKGNVNAEELIRIAREKDQNSLWDFYLNSKTKDKIEESWTKRIMIEADDMSGLAKNLFDFSNTCLKIYKLRREYILPSDYYNIAAQDFGELKKDDSLYYEKMFVLALINPYFNDGLSQLKEIGSYRPAQILIEAGSENDCYKAIMGGHNYELGFQESNRKGLKKFVTNLYGFRNYGKSN